MASEQNGQPGHEQEEHEAQEVLAEKAIADAGHTQAMYNYSQKLLEQKERELMESIAMNYGRIREVERELGNLQLQLKLTAGPKKHALELLRKKIEAQNERVACVRAKHSAAKAAFEKLDEQLRAEETAKDQLCGELNTLVQQAARAQMDKLEELKSHLESLYSNVLPNQQQQPAVIISQAPPEGASGSAAGPGPTTSGSVQQGGAGPLGSPNGSGPSSVAQQREEQERLELERQEAERRRQEAEAAEQRRRREAEAAAARSRHVSLDNPFLSPADAAAAGAGPRSPSAAGRPGQGAAGAGPAAGGRAGQAAAAGRPRPNRSPGAGSQAPDARFSGFDT